MTGIVKGNYHTFESKNKISNANKGNIHSYETRLKISQKTKGLKRSEEFKLKVSQNKIGYKYSEESKKKMSQSMRGIKKSQVFKDKMSNLKKNNTCRRKEVHQYDLEMNYIASYKSVLEAAIFLGKTQGSAITEVCNNIRKNAYGYKWKYNKIK